MNTQISIFKGKEVRKIIHQNEWWFVIEDVVAVLTDSINPKNYIRDMRRRNEELSKGWGQIAHTLDITTQGGLQKMNCANTEGIFRIIQSIPSP
jgi:DNA-damage-inducible protein D